ncbi:MAG: RidA family protein [Phycisphaeraceae bacterium]|nr:RidA family protein [Phycisphaeraceae bacterium]
MPPQIIQPRSVHSTAGVGYSHVARTGNTLYIAGQVALDKNGVLVGKGDIEAQARQVYTNLLAILEEFGGGLQNIAKLTTYLTDRAHLAGFRIVRNQTLKDPFPPNTLVFISGLAQPDYLIEIEAVAVLDG